MHTIKNFLDNVQWNQDGLVPVIAQDHKTQQVLMLAWMNRQALQATIDTQQAVYYSRSKQRLWKKGEQSGHLQKVHEIRLDCDQDALLLLVEQIGGIACHTGRASCFFSVLGKDSQNAYAWQVSEPVIKKPDDIYG